MESWISQSSESPGKFLTRSCFQYDVASWRILHHHQQNHQGIVKEDPVHLYLMLSSGLRSVLLITPHNLHNAFVISFLTPAIWWGMKLKFWALASIFWSLLFSMSQKLLFRRSKSPELWIINLFRFNFKFFSITKVINFSSFSFS